MDIPQLPLEIYWLILLSSPRKTLVQLCTSNKFLANICDNDYFWELKMAKDYRQYVNFKPENITYKVAYWKLVNNKAKIVPVRVGNKIIAQFWLTQDMLRSELYDKIYKLYLDNTDEVPGPIRIQLNVGRGKMCFFIYHNFFPGNCVYNNWDNIDGLAVESM